MITSELKNEKFYFFVVFIGSICFAFSANTLAQNTAAVFSPKRGVVCDKYICADKKGVSKSLTNQYLGAKKAKQAFSQGDFDTSAFTFSNGVFCDTTRLCCTNLSLKAYSTI
ncbi:putative signal peptide-containing protein [Acinetobacter baumannii]|uniref:YcgJ family protein n=1 Tax=Acinetobacter baumannii TaxID=470 RepID=UPI000E17098C|nr:YcgJ family protein [Acinetobacter baumannii]SUU03693.1 putative signal peptide-containing protein [Acinetobacter baumannii]SUU19932.1 putative signal peptide-containing protein [Acinetobacter baumannii]